MPFDGYFLHCVCGEINSAQGSHIYKIYQPSREELVLALRKKDFNKKLLISVKGGMGRIHFTENAPENPETPPMFCMLIRKHFSAAKFLGVKMQGFERVAMLEFSAANEMGDRVLLKIVCEFMGNTSNIILVGENGRIIDAVRKSSIEAGGRIIAPGAVYEFPESQNKLDIIKDGEEKIVKSALKKGGMLSGALVAAADGMSPLIAREISFNSFKEDVDISEKDSLLEVKKALLTLKNIIISGGTPHIIFDNEGNLKDFSFTDIKQYGSFYKTEKAESYSKLLDRFYIERERASMLRRVGGDLERLLKNLLARTNRRMNMRKKELAAAADRERLRLWGELIKANIHVIKKGDKSVRVVNYYDENGGTVDIPLDPTLSPANNAAKYFKDYKKSRNAEISLKELIENDRKEAEYLESVAYALSVSKTLSDIAGIREELTLGGYIKSPKTNRGKKQKKAIELLTYESKEGYKILVGKNNLQNDYITTVLAQKNDIWFHVKNIPGSHVVILCGGAEVSNETLTFAATLAAKNSKAAASSNVPVDYTPIKYVKKPAKAKLGMVIYTTNKTLYVTPGEEE